MTTQIDEATHTLEQTDDTGQQPPLEPDAEAGALFDRTQYDREDLQIPTVDGEGIDKIRIKFSGDVMLDRSDPADVALFNRLKLGNDIELRCSGKVAANAAGYTTNREGDLDAVIGSKTVKVDSVWILTPEQL